MFEKLGNLLQQTSQKLGISKEINACQVCHNARQFLANLDYADDIQVQYYKHQKLYIQTNHPLVSQKLSTKKNELIKFINEKSPNLPVKEIILRSD